MSDVFYPHDINFEKSDVVLNVLTKKVLPKNFATEFLEIERERRKLYEQFIEEWIVESKSIWDTIAKGKLQTFANNKKVVTVKIRNQLIRIKTERKLKSRFTVATRSVTDIDLTGYVGKYEFSAIQKSLFIEEGDSIRSKDKSKITSEI